MPPLELPPRADSVPRARGYLRKVLAEADSPADVDVATLLVTELVTNAVLHARTDLTVTVEALDSRVRVEVRDGSPMTPRLQTYAATSATGRGLRLIDALASSWGVAPDGSTGGKTVWFEVGAVAGRGASGPSGEAAGAAS